MSHKNKWPGNRQDKQFTANLVTHCALALRDGLAHRDTGEFSGAPLIKMSFGGPIL